MQLRCALLLTAIAVGCTTDPSPADLTGTWNGSYTHPTLPGTLMLQLNATEQTMSGAFVMRYPTGNAGETVVFTGSVTGTRPSPTTVSFTIVAESFTWAFAGLLTTGDLMQGTWTSQTNPGLQGSFELQRS